MWVHGHSLTQAPNDMFLQIIPFWSELINYLWGRMLGITSQRNYIHLRAKTYLYREEEIRHSKKSGYYNEISSGGRHIDRGQTSPTVPRGRLALWSLEASYPASHSDSTTFSVYNPETFSHLPIVLGFLLCSEHKS